MTKLKDLKARLMEDPEFREEYARIDGEYALIEALVRARMAAKLTQGRACKSAGHDPVGGRAAGGRAGVAVLRDAAPLRRGDGGAADSGPGAGRWLRPRDVGLQRRDKLANCRLLADEYLALDDAVLKAGRAIGAAMDAGGDDHAIQE